MLRTEWYDNQLDFDAATIVTVAGSALVLSPIVLDPRPVITGVVRLGGVPVAGAFVEVLTQDSGFDTTDSLGRFAIPVDPGTHEVLFGDFEDRFASEYWQDQYDQATATPVVVGGASVDLGSVNVGPGVNFSGTVTGPTGVPLRGIIVTAFQEAAPFESEATVTDTSGEYYIGALPPGTYKVAFEDPNDEYVGEFWNDTTLQALATPLVMAADQAAANINAGLGFNPTGGTEPPGTDASGVVRNAAGQPLSGIRVDGLTTTPTIDDAALSDFDYTDSQGRYFLTNLNGDNQFKLVYEDQDLTVSGELPYLTEWYKDRRTYNTADPITVAGTKVTGLDVVLQQSGGIQGTVTNEAGVVLPRSNVELIDVNGNFLGGTAGYTDGSYEFTSLRPGTYYVHFAFGSNFEDDEFVPEWFDDAVIQADATEIVVEEGEFSDGIDGALADALRTVERPTISGKVRVGRTVSAETGLWNLTGGTTFAYQWLRGNTVVGTEPTYEVVKFDAGKKLQLVVSAVNGELTGLARSQAVRAKFTSKVKSSSKDGCPHREGEGQGPQEEGDQGQRQDQEGQGDPGHARGREGRGEHRALGHQGPQEGQEQAQARVRRHEADRVRRRGAADQALTRSPVGEGAMRFPRPAVRRPGSRGPVPRRRSVRLLDGRDHEAVAHVADRADQRLVLRAELGPQPADVHVDRAGAAEVVVAPDLLEQLLAAEDAAGVLGEVLEELELLERQVERTPADLGGVRRVVDDHLAGADHVGLGVVGVAVARSAGRWPAGCGPRARPARRCAARRRPCPSRGRRRRGRPRSPRAAPGRRCRSCGSAGTGRGRGPARAAPSTSSRSASGASSRALPSEGRIFTWWPSRERPGSTSTEGCRAFVSRSRVLIQHSSAWARHGLGSGEARTSLADGEGYPAMEQRVAAGDDVETPVGVITLRYWAVRPGRGRCRRGRCPGDRAADPGRPAQAGRGPASGHQPRGRARRLLRAGRRPSRRLAGPGDGRAWRPATPSSSCRPSPAAEDAAGMRRRAPRLGRT